MASYSYALIVVGLINIFFAIYTWRSSRHSQSVRFFAASVLSVGLWGLGLAGFLGSNTESLAIALAKFHYVASIYLGYFLLIFILAISKKGKVLISQQALFQIPILLVALVTIFSDKLLITGVHLEETGNVALLYRPGHIVYGVVFVIYYLSTLVINLYYILRSRGIAQKQLLLIFWGLFLAGILGGIFNLILPILGNYKLIWVGPQFTIIFLGLTFIGILKYQLFNIRLLFSKVSFVVGSALLLYATFIILFWVNDRLFESLFDWEAIVFGMFVALVFAVVYEKYKGFLLAKISSKILNPGFEASRYIKKFNNNLGKVVTEENILSELSQVIKETINPIYFSVILNREADVINKQFTGNKVFNQKHIFNTIKSTPRLNRESITLSELVGAFQIQSDDVISTNQEFIDTLEKNDIQLLIPVYYDKVLTAILVLGKRDLNNSLYIDQELSFLESLASVTGVSLARAKLYEQVEDLNRNLQQKVNEQTKELQIKVEQLEEARRKENDMIDIMGHELRTPATVVKLNASFLTKFIDEVQSDPEGYKKYVKRIQDAIENEIKLINTLLSSAKLEGDKIELNPEEIDIRQEIEMALHGNEQEAIDKGLTLINQTDPNTPSIYADKARIVEVLNNLISNAIKYTENGGVGIITRYDDDFVRVSVSDTGKGIPKEDIPKLGQKFYRVNTYIESSEDDQVGVIRPGGTGLGLYVTFSLVKKMGGEITVTSEVGKGSTFTFSIPRFKGQSTPVTVKSSSNMFERLGLVKGKA